MSSVAGFPNDFSALSRLIERELIRYFVLERGFKQCTLAEWIAVTASGAAFVVAALGFAKPTSVFLAETSKSILYLVAFAVVALATWGVFLLRIERWSFRGRIRYPTPANVNVSLLFRFDRVPQYDTEFRIRFCATDSTQIRKETVWTSDLTRFFSEDGRFLANDFFSELEQAIGNLFVPKISGTTDAQSQ